MPRKRSLGPDFLGVLRVLARRQGDFIVVGGVCAAFHGAPVTTFDLGVVHSRAPDNIERLLSALDDLEAFYRMAPERKLKSGPSHLSSPGHQLMMTRHGPLDLLRAVGKGHDYAQLLKHAVELRAGAGVRIRVLDLATLIRVKEETAGEKDRATLAILRRTLEEIAVGKATP